MALTFQTPVNPVRGEGARRAREVIAKTSLSQPVCMHELVVGSDEHFALGHRW